MSPARTAGRFPLCTFACVLVAAAPWDASAQAGQPAPRPPASQPAGNPAPDAPSGAPAGPATPPAHGGGAAVTQAAPPAPNAGSAAQAPASTPEAGSAPTPKPRPTPDSAAAPAQAAPPPTATAAEAAAAPAPAAAAAPEADAEAAPQAAPAVEPAPEIPPPTIEQLQQAHDEKAALARSAHAERTTMLQGRLDKAARAERESSALLPWIVTGTGIAATLLGLGIGVGRALSCSDSCTQSAWPGWMLVVGSTVATAGSVWLVLKGRDQAELRDRRRRLEEELRRERWQAGDARRELTLSATF